MAPVRKMVTLKRTERGGLGMTLCTALNGTGARVEQVIPDTPAALSGKIKIGDHILQANGLDLEQNSHDEVCAAMKLGNPITLLLEEDSTPLSNQDPVQLPSPSKGKKKTKRGPLSFLGTTKRKAIKKGGTKFRLPEFRTVKIPCVEGQGLGLKILTDERAKVARISEVIAGRAAADLGTIMVGDRILNANNVLLKNLNHDEVVRAMLQFLPDPDSPGVMCTVLDLQTDKSELFDESLRKTVVIHRSPGEGIGLKIHSAAQNGISLGARISEVIPGRPAARVPDILPGDWLIEVNGTNLERLSHDEIVHVLVGLKGTAITLVLEADDSPFDAAPAEAAPSQDRSNAITGDISHLTNVRDVAVFRDPVTNLLGFHFYSELGAGLPWTRVTGIDPEHPTSKTTLQNEDVIISVDDVDVLNAGHDVILRSFQGEGPGTLKMQVGRPPSNEKPSMYSDSNQAALSPQEAAQSQDTLYPDLAVYRVSVLPSSLTFVKNERGVVRVASIVEGAASPCAGIAGVVVDDFLLQVAERSVLDNTFETLEDILEASVATNVPIELVLGRPYTYKMVTLERPAGTREELGDKFKTFGFGVRKVTCASMVSGNATGNMMVCDLEMDGISAGVDGLENGDVIFGINDVPLAAIDGHTVSQMLAAYDGSILELSLRRSPVVPMNHVKFTKEEGQSFGFGVKTNPDFSGAYVSVVGPGSPAAGTTLAKEQHIERINGHLIGLRNHQQIIELIQSSNTIDLTMSETEEPIEMSMERLRTAVLTRANFSGLGMKIVTKEDGISYPRISHVEPRGCAEASGAVIYGDRIISCNGKVMAGITSAVAVKMLLSAEVLNLQMFPDASPMYDTSQNKVDKATKANRKAAKNAQASKVGPKHIGCRVNVKGHDVPGTMRWCGNDKLDGELRYGIELDASSDNVVVDEQARQYFNCANDTGVLALPDDVTFVPIAEGDVGQKVRVAGVKCIGKLVFFGPHAKEDTMRCGVVLDKQMGFTNGTVKDHKYFECKDGFGVLTKSEKVYLWNPAPHHNQHGGDMAELLKSKSVDGEAKPKQKNKKEKKLKKEKKEGGETAESAKPKVSRVDSMGLAPLFSQIFRQPVSSLLTCIFTRLFARGLQTAEEARYSGVSAKAAELKRLMEDGDSSDDDEDLPDMPDESSDDEDLPDVPNESSDDEDEDLPDMPDEDLSEDESLPDIPDDFESSEDEDLPDMPDEDDSEDDELPPGPETNELDLDFSDPFLFGHDTTNDTEI